MTEKKLQYQLSNGMWTDCRYDNIDKTEMMLVRCESNNSMTRDEVLAALSAGKKLRNDPADWYSNCRYEPAPEAPAPPIKEFIPDNEEYGY